MAREVGPTLIASFSLSMPVANGSAISLSMPPADGSAAGGVSLSMTVPADGSGSVRVATTVTAVGQDSTVGVGSANVKMVRGTSKAKAAHNYKPAETLAAVKAALEANEIKPDSSNEVRFTEASAAFERHLREFTKPEMAREHNVEVLTLEEIAIMRYWRTLQSGLLDGRFDLMKRECNNAIMALYKKLLNPDGSIPTGTTIQEILANLRQELYVVAHPAADPKIPATAKFYPHALTCFVTFGPPAAFLGRHVVPSFAGDGLALEAAAGVTSRESGCAAKKQKQDKVTDDTATALANTMRASAASPSGSPQVRDHSPCNNCLCRQESCGWWPPAFQYRPELMARVPHSQWGASPWPFMD